MHHGKSIGDPQERDKYESVLRSICVCGGGGGVGGGGAWGVDSDIQGK